MDAQRIGAYGFSLGGEVATYSSIDPRIKAAVVAGFVAQYSPDPARPCACRIIPDFEKWLRIADMGLLFAPDRLLIVESGEHDNIESAISEGQTLRYGFDVLGGSNNFKQIVMGGRHGFYGGPETMGALNSFLRPNIRERE